LTVDVWVASTGLPSRLVLEITAPGRAEGSLKITADMLDYNVEVDASPPPAREVAKAPG
jgi:hypothetical protein